MGKIRLSWLLALVAVGVALLIAFASGDDEEFPTDDPIELDV